MATRVLCTFCTNVPFYVHYSKAAEALGTYGERVDSPKEVVPAIKRAIKVTQEGRPAFLEMITKEEIPLSRYW